MVSNDIAQSPDFCLQGRPGTFYAGGFGSGEQYCEDLETLGRRSRSTAGVSSGTRDRIRACKWNQTLSQDQMTRASALIGIFKGLNLLFDQAMADRWPKLRNTGPLFNNLPPVEAMIEGGIPYMLE